VIFISFLLLIGIAACGSDAVLPSDIELDDYIAAPARPPVQEEAYASVPVASPAEAETVEEGLSSEEIRELLENIPYPGIAIMRVPDWLAQTGQPIVTSETALELADFIYSMNGWWVPLVSESFSSPEEAEPQFVFERAFWATSSMQWQDPERPNFHPELDAITPHIHVHTTRILLHSHMEQTALELFGVELKISNYAIPNHFRVYDLFGVYAYSLSAMDSDSAR